MAIHNKAPVRKMIIEEAKRIIEDIQTRYGIDFSNYHEERREGRVKFIYFALKLKIDEPSESLKKGSISSKKGSI